MAYRFIGFLAQPLIERPAGMNPFYVWREITVPFVGVGVCLPNLVQDELEPWEAKRLLTECGLDNSSKWIYLSYSTWAGSIESVYGLGVAGGLEFGPIGKLEEWNDDESHSMFLTLMDKFGVAESEALNFPPFARGFWGE